MNADGTTLPEGLAPEILDAALSRPPGEADEDDLGCGAYALWAAMTRLSHEVKLQGRAFAALRERLENDLAANSDAEEDEAIEERIASVSEQALAVFRESVEEAQRRAEAANRREARVEDDLLSTLTDIHDRLARSLDVLRQNISRSNLKAGWWKKLLPREEGPGAVDSLIEGQELALRRIRDELARRGMREIAALGKRFDPEVMRAVATDPSEGAEDGTVTAVVRGGWFRDEIVWRPAEVTVARRRE
jgi:molecular chaperone GrpE